MPSDNANPLALAMDAWLPGCDFGVMAHGFADHGRDYEFIIENNIGGDTGTHRLTFTHVVSFRYETAVADEFWRQSWDDRFIDFDAYNAAGEPEGYVWGTNWSLAWPGFEAPHPTPDSDRWTKKLGHLMYEMSIATDRFRITMVFHDLRTEKLATEAPTVNKAVIPLGKS